MAKPIHSTPVLRGADADAILEELQNGTRSTPARKAMFQLVNQVKLKHLEVMTKDFGANAVIQAGD